LPQGGHLLARFLPESARDRWLLQKTNEVRDVLFTAINAGPSAASFAVHRRY
jgi:hypothetical protein